MPYLSESQDNYFLETAWAIVDKIYYTKIKLACVASHERKLYHRDYNADKFILQLFVSTLRVVIALKTIGVIINKEKFASIHCISNNVKKSSMATKCFEVALI